MKNRKISTAIAEKVMTGVLTILMAISVTACGSTKGAGKFSCHRSDRSSCHN